MSFSIYSAGSKHGNLCKSLETSSKITYFIPDHIENKIEQNVKEVVFFSGKEYR